MLRINGFNTGNVRYDLSILLNEQTSALMSVTVQRHRFDNIGHFWNGRYWLKCSTQKHRTGVNRGSPVRFKLSANNNNNNNEKMQTSFHQATLFDIVRSTVHWKSHSLCYNLVIVTNNLFVIIYLHCGSHCQHWLFSPSSSCWVQDCFLTPLFSPLHHRGHHRHKTKKQVCRPCVIRHGKEISGRLLW